MPEKIATIAEVIDQLAVQVIMVEPDDVMTLGSILEQLEAIEKMSIENGLQPIGILSGALKKLVEKIALNELKDLKEGLDLLDSGVKILQVKISHPDRSHPVPDEESFWERIEALTGEKGPPAPAQEGKGSDTGSLDQETLDLTQGIEIYNDFILEAIEHLESIELNLIRLEQTPEDKECINSIFRPFHTIKGVSGFLNLQEIHRFSHAMESLLDDARNDKLLIHQGIIDFVLEAVDFLKDMILDLKANVEQGRLSPSRFEMEPYFEKIALLQKGEPLERASNSPKAGEDDLEMPRSPLGEILSSRGIVSAMDVQEALKKQTEDKPGLKIGEILIKENKVRPRQVVEALREQKRTAAQLTENTVKVDTSKLDNLVDMVGELVIAQSLVQQNPLFSSVHDQKLMRDFSQLKRITAELQRLSMSLRMTPIRQTFQKMIRLVRDLSKKSGKEVDLQLSGEETEIDRNMVEALYDPLVHMIRNAVDHGIEAPSKRKEADKPETGQIFLRAYQKGGNVVIEIEDDGQGLNRDKILKKAKERGLISDDQPLTEHQIDNLIFRPGFSTADQVTDVSGRGVGMDVVKKAIEKLKGKVEIFSDEGKGSRFVIRIPLTLAIMDGIKVRIGEERYIIPTVFIKETLRPNREDISTVQNKGDLIKVRNTLLPLIRLHHLLGVTSEKREPWEALVVVVENDGHQKGLMIDDLIGKQEVVIKNLGEMLKTVKGVAGATIMGDGQVGLILDIHGIFEIYQNT